VRERERERERERREERGESRERGENEQRGRGREPNLTGWVLLNGSKGVQARFTSTDAYWRDTPATSCALTWTEMMRL